MNNAFQIPVVIDDGAAGQLLTDHLLPPGTTSPPRVILVAGPPGSGKGTLCKALARAPGGFAHVSTGDLFRDAIARDTPLGRVARAHIERGDFVPDDLTLQLVRDEICLNVIIGVKLTGAGVAGRRGLGPTELK